MQVNIKRESSFGYTPRMHIKIKHVCRGLIFHLHILLKAASRNTRSENKSPGLVVLLKNSKSSISMNVANLQSHQSRNILLYAPFCSAISAELVGCKYQ